MVEPGKTEWSPILRAAPPRNNCGDFLDRFAHAKFYVGSEKPISFGKCRRLSITSSSIIKSDIRSWDCQRTSSYKILEGWVQLETLEEPGIQEDRVFGAFT